jgi:hypothetical protein
MLQYYITVLLISKHAEHQPSENVVSVWFRFVWPNTAQWSLSQPYMQCFGRTAALVELARTIVRNISRLGLFRLANNRHLKHESEPTCKSSSVCLRCFNSSGRFVVKIVSSRKQKNPTCPYIRRFCKRTIYHCHYEICGCHSNELLKVNTTHDQTSCLDLVCRDYSASIGNILYS